MPRFPIHELRAVEPTEVSQQFTQGMYDRMAVSMHKYGRWADNAGHVDVHAQVEIRWQKYLETGNTEWLMDVANLAMMEFMEPQHPDAHFRPTDSDESPGSLQVDGTVVHSKSVARRLANS